MSSSAFFSSSFFSSFFVARGTQHPLHTSAFSFGAPSTEKKTEEKPAFSFGATSFSFESPAPVEKKTTEEELVLMQENYMIYNVAVKELASTITQIKTALNVSAS